MRCPQRNRHCNRRAMHRCLHFTSGRPPIPIPIHSHRRALTHAGSPLCACVLAVYLPVIVFSSQGGEGRRRRRRVAADSDSSSGAAAVAGWCRHRRSRARARSATSVRGYGFWGGGVYRIIRDGGRRRALTHIHTRPAPSTDLTPSFLHQSPRKTTGWVEVLSSLSPYGWGQFGVAFALGMCVPPLSLPTHH